MLSTCYHSSGTDLLRNALDKLFENSCRLNWATLKHRGYRQPIVPLSLKERCSGVTLFVQKVGSLDGQTKNSATNRELYVNGGVHSLIDVFALSNALPHSEKCKARGFTVIVDGRKSQWNIVKTVVLMLQVHTL